MKKIIKKILKEGDWDWAKGEINPWVEYNVILFDIIPTEEDTNKYIKMALETKAISNYEAWLTGRENDLEWIIKYSKTPGGAVLLIHGSELFYADYETYNRRLKSKEDKVIKYSQLIDKNDLTESEDMDWIRDIIPMDIIFKKGDRVRVHNMSTTPPFLEWLGDYSIDYLNGEYIEGTVDILPDDKNNFILITDLGGDEIYFPYKKRMEDLSHKEQYQGLDLFYEPL